MLCIFSCVYWPSVCFLWRNVSLGLQSNFLTGLFVFLILSCMSCLYFGDITFVSCFVCNYFLPFSCCCSVAQCVQLFVTSWTAACQASLSFTISWSLLKLMSIKSMMSCKHLILCHPLFLLTSIFPSIRIFSSESALHIKWPKDWSFSFSICPSNEYSGLISLGLTGLIYLLSKGLSRVFSNTTV